MAEAIFPPLPSDVFVPEHLDPAKGFFLSVFDLWEISVCFKLAHQIYVDYLEKLSCPDGFACSTELTHHLVYL